VGLITEGGTAGGLNFRICFKGVLGSASDSASTRLSGALTDSGVLFPELKVPISDSGLSISDFGVFLGVGVEDFSCVRVSIGKGRAIF